MLDSLLLAVAGINDLWYMLPLVVTVSLVYAATRHEQTSLILRHAGETAVRIVGFMVIVFIILWLITWWVR